MVVSDGAGTALFADKASAYVSREFARTLIDLSKEIDGREPGAWINDRIIRNIISIREGLRDLAGGDALRDYHCTLVACLLGDGAGVLIHIGDGLIFGGLLQSHDSPSCALFDLPFISLAENGEYSNETFFITEADWIKHLRITPVSKPGWVFIGTDGGVALAMASDAKPKEGFLGPLIRKLYLESDPQVRNRALNNVLSDPRADAITSDDKTLCIAIRLGIDLLGAEAAESATGEGGEAGARAVVPMPSSADEVHHSNNKTERISTWRVALGRRAIGVLLVFSCVVILLIWLRL